MDQLAFQHLMELERCRRGATHGSSRYTHGPYHLHGNKQDCLSVAGSLAESIAGYPDLHFGLYFSQFEWFNPTYLSDKTGGFKTQNYVAVSTPHTHYTVL